MLTQQQVHDFIDYNPETGIATWRMPGIGRQKNKCVGFIRRGSKRSHPYRYVLIRSLGIEPQKPFSHLVHFYMTGRWPADEMDHVNGNTLDDRWSNLRESTRSQNEANRGVRKNNKLGIKGVHQERSGRYRAKFWRGRAIQVGTFDDPNTAKIALSAAMKAHDGEFFRA